jgi:hypothetical protein
VDKVVAADRGVVEELTGRLIACYEEFISEYLGRNPEGMAYIDGFMAAHNFHKAIVLDLEGRNEEDDGPDRTHFLRRSAVDTMIRAFGLEHLYREIEK